MSTNHSCIQVKERSQQEKTRKKKRGKRRRVKGERVKKEKGSKEENEASEAIGISAHLDSECSALRLLRSGLPLGLGRRDDRLQPLQCRDFIQ